MPYADPEKQKQYLKKWHEKRKEERNRKARERYHKNIEYQKLRSKIKYIRTKDKRRKYQIEHREQRLEWEHKNKEKKYLVHREWRKKGNVRLFNNPFPNEVKVHYHHFVPNFCLTIPLPSCTHHRGHNETHYVHCNEWIEKIYCLDMEKILN